MRSRSRETERPDRSPRGERLQKILAGSGLGSRRACEELIRAGRVQVNGRTAREPGTRADPGRDRISVDGRRIGRPARLRTYVLYKPRGVVSTTRDPRARRTVIELVPGATRLFPVGRLDAQSEGLLVLTNDGELAQQLLHPSFGVLRTYRVSVEGRVLAPALRQLTAGTLVEGRRQAAQSARLVKRSVDHSVIEIQLTEGRRRQIRQMMQAIGHPVRRLVRTRFGPLRLGGLEPGEWRRLRPDEARALGRLAGRGAGSPAGSSRRNRMIRKT